MSKPGARILVVDDEIEIIRALQRNLVAHGYKAFPARSGEDAIDIFQQHRPDLVLLDLMLPGMSGLEVCRWIRTTSNTPIIVLSVKGAEKDKVQALDAGADDYILKPFGMNEVLARIRAALRHAARVPLGTAPQIRIGPLEMDLARRDVRLNEQELQLTPTEYDLLKVFLMHRGKILTRQMLLTDVWGENSSGRSHSLHVYVAQLRQKIEPLPDRPRFILTIPGVGYRFNDEDGEEINVTKS
ncbi:MAG: response regulator transcription factor [Ktedonobacteraceae bacterium]|nr:response regulator transcription factor [Ktedonobacteraceae bacterium]